MTTVKALVTGGAGFIGSNIVAGLVGGGAAVTVLDNFSSGHRVNLEPIEGVSIAEGDVREASDVRAAMRGAELVFHLAASVGNARSVADPVQDSQVNVFGTLNVLEAAHAAGARKVVFSSSAGIFGELKRLPIREDHPAEPDSPYGVSKLAAEKHCLVYTKLFALPTVCLRYFNVYGPNQRYDAYGNVIPIFVHRVLRSEPLIVFGDGEQTRDFVHVADVVQANLRAAASTATGAFNVGSGTAITINRLATLVNDASGAAVPIERGPVRPFDVRDSLADVSAARGAFGYAPAVDLAAGLREYVAWARAHLVEA